ncbi:RxLR effector protein [Phytophthora megakarya]|uniref:RxLR effector protein n=1 Tax=Phytophthora megakarya TaxID=4795 RepID=A0A225WBK7_9STRA|nr:RxLR effector protein [Phytophthora megakarya]
MTVHVNPTKLLIILLLVAIGLACAVADISSTSNHALRFYPNTSQPKSHLKASPTPARSDNTAEDRTFNGAKLKEVAKYGTQKITTAAKSFILTAELKMMPKNQQTVNQLFSRFKVKDVKTNLFESVQFRRWSASVTKLFSKDPDAANKAIVLKLTMEHTDKELATMLAAAKQVPETKNIASNILKAQMDHWVEQKKSADEVFQFLKLDEAGDKLLANPLLNRWMKFVFKRKQYPDEVLISYLRNHYTDEGLANVLLGAKRGSGIKLDFQRQEGLIVQEWVKAGKTVDEVYDLLKLRNVESSDFLQSPALANWLAFMTRLGTPFYNAKTGPYELLYRKLISQYDDRGLANVLLGPKGDFGKKFDYHKLDDLILQKWVESGKTVDEVYKLLKIPHVEASKFLQNPALENWLSFVTKLDAQLDNPNSGQYKLLYTKLTRRYDDNGLASVLLGPKGDLGQKFDYQKLDDLLLQKWVKTGKSVDDVYDLLKLRNVQANNLLQNPALETWMSFVGKLDPRFYNPYEELYKKLYVNLGENKLDDLIRVTKNGDHTRAKNIAEKLEEEILRMQRERAVNLAKLHAP